MSSLVARTEAVQWTAEALTVRSLDLSIGGKRLVTDATFQIRKEDRIALMGRNGCGKSTLFHWITEPRERAPPWSVYEVAQELPPSSETITTVVLAAHLERGSLWRRQAELEEKDDLTEEELAEYTRNGEQLAAMHADADPARAKRILHGLGFSGPEMDRPLSTFSGGWRARVALAMGLFMEPDLLLLDEPTNHLDLEGVLWLTEYLRVWRKAFIVISHNAGFVREVATTQWLVECGQLTSYRCSYSRYLQQRALDAAKIKKDWDLLEREVQALRRKGTPAATTAADALFEKRTREGIVRPAKPYAPRFYFVDGGSGGAGTRTALLKTDGARLGYGDRTVLDGVTFSLYGGERLALVGANGSGKTTLLRFLGGDLAPLAGSVESRPGLRVVKFDQHFYHTLPMEMSATDYITSVSAEGVGVRDIRRILGASGLEGGAHTQAIGTLSGGQKARVYFAAISAQLPDILLMDEPTNHLDMETVEALAEGLCAFPGSVVIVSHDLEFLEKTSTALWETVDGRLVAHRGDVDEGLTAYVESVVEAMEI